MEEPIKLEFTPQDLQYALLELQIKILAHQKTIITLLAEKLGEDDQDIKFLIDDANEQCNNYAKVIFQELYSRRGKINLDDLLK